MRNYFKISLFANLKRLISNHPITSNSVVYTTLFVSSEFCQQTVAKKIMPVETLPYDSTILGHYLVLGVMVSPPLYFWYRWLDNQFVGAAWKVVVKKVAIDQLIAPPLLVFFYVGLSVMEGTPNVWEECREKIWPTYLATLAFWLPAQSLNFLYVPPQNRVMYVGACEFVSVNILCWFKSHYHPKTTTDEDKD